MATDVQLYGDAPHRIALIHGGPGAAGDMMPVARALSGMYSVIEPYQTKLTIAGQVEELHSQLLEYCQLPVTLVGHSWGAWLAYIYTAKHPETIKKLILVGSGPFTAEYAETVETTRLERLGSEGIAALKALLKEMDDPTGRGSGAIERIGAMFARADTFDADENGAVAVEFRPEVFRAVWPEADELRRNGMLLSFAAKINCPVVAIHGDYDPHPHEEVSGPLTENLKDFSFTLLKKCGHKPWIERHAKEHFYDILCAELGK